MHSFKQYQVIETTRDLNPVIKKGMKGVILDIWTDDAFEVEFLDNEGFNFQYDNIATFTVNSSDIKPSDTSNNSRIKRKTSNSHIPKWLRYVCLIAGLLYLLWLLFFSTGQQRTDFPVF